MEKFMLTEKEIDIISEALTTYSELVTKGSYAYTTEEVDEVAAKFA